MLTIDNIRKDNRSFEKQLRKPSGKAGVIVSKFLLSHNYFQNRWAISLLKIGTNDDVLEIGFGSGNGINEISKKKKVGRIWGIDFSKLMFEVAAKLNKKNIQDGKVKLIFGNISNYDFGSMKFDKVLGVNVLYFWKSPLKVLKRINSILNPGGKVAFFIYHKDNQKDRVKEGIFKNYSGEEVSDMLLKAGFGRAFFRERKFTNNSRLGVCIVGEK